MIEELEKKLNKKQIKQKDRYKKFAFAMIDKDISQRSLANMLGVDQSMICRVMWGEKKSKRLERKLCEILEINIKDVA